MDSYVIIAIILIAIIAILSLNALTGIDGFLPFAHCFGVAPQIDES